MEVGSYGLFERHDGNLLGDFAEVRENRVRHVGRQARTLIWELLSSCHVSKYVNVNEQAAKL
jgi:hypothetical protein